MVPLTPSGRPRMPESWEAATLALMRGYEVDYSSLRQGSCKRTLPTPDRLRTILQTEPEAVLWAFDVAIEDCQQMGEPDAAEVWLDLRGQVADYIETPNRDPWDTPKRPKAVLPDYLEAEEVTAILEAARRSGRSGVRNAAAIALCYYGLLRVGEAVHLRAADMSVHLRTLRTPPEGKTGSRAVVLPEDAAPYLTAWDALRPEYAERTGEPCAFWLVSKTGKRLDPSAINRALDRYADKAGIGGVGEAVTAQGATVQRHRVRPHMLRHSGAMRVVRNPKASPVDVQRALGHKRMSSTAVYLHMDDKRYREVVDGTSW